MANSNMKISEEGVVKVEFGKTTFSKPPSKQESVSASDFENPISPVHHKKASFGG